jgi:hypothetical protein
MAFTSTGFGQTCSKDDCAALVSEDSSHPLDQVCTKSVIPGSRFLWHLLHSVQLSRDPPLLFLFACTGRLCRNTSFRP